MWKQEVQSTHDWEWFIYLLPTLQRSNNATNYSCSHSCSIRFFSGGIMIVTMMATTWVLRGYNKIE